MNTYFPFSYSGTERKKKDHYNLNFDYLDKGTRFIIWIRMKNMFPFGQDFIPLEIFKIIVDYAKTEPYEIFKGIEHLKLEGGFELEIAATGEMLGDFEIEQRGNTLELLQNGISSNKGVHTSIDCGGWMDYFNFGNGVSINNITSGGISVNGNRVTMNGVSYTLPPYRSLSMCNNQIILDGKTWDPNEDSFKKKSKMEEEKKTPKKRYFLSPSTNINKLTVRGSCKVKKVAEKFVAYDDLKVEGSGSVNVDSCTFSALDVKCSGSGRIRMNKCFISRLSAKVSGSGSVTGNSDTTVRELTTNVSGGSKISDFFVCESISAKATGGSRVELSKSPDCQVKKSTSGGASIDIR